MKKHLLALLVYLSTITIGNGQTNVYHPFPDSVIWRVDYNYNFIFQFPCAKNYYFQYYSTGDTLINSSVYRKISVNEVQDTNICWPPGYLPVPGYVGAVKDDSLTNKTFFVFPNSTTDSLLYDYNLAVGDTIKGIISQFYNQFNTNRTVLTVDSILISGQYRKRWNFSQNEYGDSIYIIEGIGTSSGLLEPLYPWNLEWTDRHLICVKDSLQTYFISNHNSTIGCNLLYTKIIELNFLNNFSIRPNPFSNEATLKTDQDLKNATVTITNIFGQQVKQTKNITGKEIKIHRGNLSGGIYFLQLMQENKIILSCKLIIPKFN
jgi:Secretion system C-terminal sorting domain